MEPSSVERAACAVLSRAAQLSETSSGVCACGFSLLSGFRLLTLFSVSVPAFRIATNQKIVPERKKS